MAFRLCAKRVATGGAEVEADADAGPASRRLLGSRGIQFVTLRGLAGQFYIEWTRAANVYQALNLVGTDSLERITVLER